MTTPAANQSPNTRQPASAKLKLLQFAFPFQRKGHGPSAAAAQFTDEHDIYRLLAAHEQGGGYLVSRQGVWHGGIHVTEAGTGQSLDLDAGVRCLADGVLVAFRANNAYPVSEVKAADGTSSQAAYSTGFALVRHEMEFPGGSKLKFYSLYMHLMGNADYGQNFPHRPKPPYWSRQWTITDRAQDKPLPRAGQAADGQIGLHVRRTPNGQIIGIVPQGANVTIGRQEKGWGQAKDLQGSTLYPPEAGGYADPASAIGGWIYLGAQNGGPVAKESIPDTMFDRVIVTTDPACTKADPQGSGGGIAVKAGDLIGHMGRYDPVGGNTTSDRRAHIEVFCDDSIVPYLARGRDWIEQNSPFKARWEALGLPSEPTILRIAPGTVLYQRTPDNRFIPGPEPQLNTAGVVQVCLFAELARNRDSQYTEPNEDPISKRRVNWWQVESANVLGHAIKGWVREANHPGGGRVTCEFAQAWIDFNALPADAHDTAHTIFSTTQQWVDYRTGANAPALADRSKLSPLMLTVYDALFTTGNGSQAANELSTLSQTVSGGYSWLMQAASRLIVKHESEWSNPSKWQQLYSALGQKADPQAKARLDADQKRIPTLVWWDEIQARVAGFPGPDVYHINPIGLVGNFIEASVCVPLPKAQLLALTISSGFEGGHPMDYAATAGNFDGMGMSYGLIQWNAGSGTLAPVLSAMRSADPVSFKAAFPPASNYATLDSAITSGNSGDLYNWAVNQQSINPGGWKAPFQNLANIQAFKDIQLATAVSERHHHVMAMVELLRSLSPDLMRKVELVSYCALFDVAVQQQSLTPAVQAIKSRVASDHPASQSALVRIAVEERAKAAKHVYVADCMSRRIGILQQSPYSYTAYGHTSQRTNANFNLISQDAHAYVCQI